MFADYKKLQNSLMKSFTKISLIMGTVIILTLFGCISINKGSTTIRGNLQETKDGYYINGYAIEELEISKYNPQFNFPDYENKEVEIIGKVKEIEIDNCTNSSGEISQCRAGKTSYIYEITSIK